MTGKTTLAQAPRRISSIIKRQTLCLVVPEGGEVRSMPGNPEDEYLKDIARRAVDEAKLDQCEMPEAGTGGKRTCASFCARRTQNSSARGYA